MARCGRWILLLVPLVLTLGKAATDAFLERFVIPGWYLQSSLKVSKTLQELSMPGVDMTSWHRVGRRSTVMAGLLENNIYNDTTLFYSDNLHKLDTSSFQAPWLFREEVKIDPLSPGQHMFLITHGITSKADIFLNGVMIAPASIQQGSYAGRRYDVTPHIRAGSNVLLIQTYPTNYLRDFALGFLDWNPYPSDNGTGIWRDVELKRTGPVSMSAMRIRTDFTHLQQKEVIVTVRTDLENHSGSPMKGMVQGTIQSNDRSHTWQLSTPFKVNFNSNITVSINATLKDPQIWWPAMWGSQPLYTTRLNVSLNNGQISDVAPPVRFGIRQVISEVNSYGDRKFSINGHPFLVKGAGYSPDMFLRFDMGRVKTIFQYMLDMRLNTVRIEGKQEQPEFYDLADRMGLMVLAGWECCDKWEAWDYNHDAAGLAWTDADYTTAQISMLHEAEMMQTHPCTLGFLIGSDYWPNDRASRIYIEALQQMDWPNPVIASASKRGYPDELGPSGMKMDGPYDWVPPNYWYADRMGAAFGFGSELGAGVGTPELTSLRRFLSAHDLEALWKQPDQGLYHMSRNDSKFYTRSIYNQALFTRYGPPDGLKDYVQKAQIMDYEATRAQVEAYSMQQSAKRPATGYVYWMLNSAWPSLHWQLLDYYLRPHAAYFGAKTGARVEHVAYNYEDRISYQPVFTADWSSKLKLGPMPPSGWAVRDIKKLRDVGFLRLLLKDPTSSAILGRNVYWLSAENDKLNWGSSTWYTTPVNHYANYTPLTQLSIIPVTCEASTLPPREGGMRMKIVLKNTSKAPAFFLHFTALTRDTQEEIAPVFWSDNYITLFPQESYHLTLTTLSPPGRIVLDGVNVRQKVVSEG